MFVFAFQGGGWARAGGRGVGVAWAAAVLLLLSAGALCAAQPAGDARPVEEARAAADTPPDAELAALDQTLIELGLVAPALKFDDGVALTRALSTRARRAAWLRLSLEDRGTERAANWTALDAALQWLDAVPPRCEALAGAAGDRMPAPASRDAPLLTSEQWRALARDAQRARGVLLAAHTVNVSVDVEIRGAEGSVKSTFRADEAVEVAWTLHASEADPAISAVAVTFTLGAEGAPPLEHKVPRVAISSTPGERQVWRIEPDAARAAGEWKLSVAVASADPAWPAKSIGDLVKLAESTSAVVTITAPATASSGGGTSEPAPSRTRDLSGMGMGPLLSALRDDDFRGAVEWYLGLSETEPANLASWGLAGKGREFDPDASIAAPRIAEFQNRGIAGARDYLDAAARYKANRVRSNRESEKFRGGALAPLAVQAQPGGAGFNFVGSPTLSSTPTTARYDVVVELVRVADGSVEGVALLRTQAAGAAESYYRVEWLASAVDDDMKQRLRGLVQQQMPARNRVDALVCLDRDMRSFRDGGQQWLGATSVRLTPFASFEMQMPPGNQAFSTRQRQFLEGFPGAR